MRKNTLLKSLAVASILGSLLLAGGCQTPGKVISTEECAHCPTCKTETVTTPIKGLTYTRHVCPGCKMVVDTGKTPNYDELGDFGNEIQVCTHCQSVVTPCPVCSSK